MAKNRRNTVGSTAEQRSRTQTNEAIRASSGSHPYFLLGIDWGTSQVGAEGGPNSESDMSVAGESSPARNRAATKG